MPALLAYLLVACGGGGDPAGGTPPALTVQPASASVTDHAAASFNISASGSDLSYQWQRSVDSGASWHDIAAATSSSYVIAAVDVSMNGQQFRVVVTAAGVSVTSSAALLTVEPAAVAPEIVVQPASQTAIVGGSVSLSVTAVGTTLAYRWQNSTDGTAWADLAGATTGTLSIPDLGLADNGRQLRVVVSNDLGHVTSQAALLTVNSAPAAPQITAQPVAASVTAPQAASFTVTVIGTPAPACQWQSSADSGATWVTLVGATACSYTTPATAATDNGKRFRAVVSNSSGNMTSAAAVLTVTPTPVAPTISTQPQDASVEPAAQATFSVVAAGTPTPGYQWQLSTDEGATFANINGATASSYAFAAALPDSGHIYRVVVSNSAGSVTSRGATLHVNPSATSPLLGRTWQPGQLLETSDGPVTVTRSVIDDQGRVTVIFGQGSAAAAALYVTRGKPSASGTPAIWTAPQLLDSRGTATDLTLRVSPAGNVLALWGAAEACSPITYRTSGTCIVLYVATYRADTDRWETPLPIPGWAPTTSGLWGLPDAAIDDQGNVVVFGNQGWVRSGASYQLASVLLLRSVGETNFREQLLTDPKLGRWSVAMDNSGNLLLACNYTASGGTAVAAFRGTVSSGVGATPQILDTNLTNSFQYVAAGVGGQQIVVWLQTLSGALSAYSASPTGSFIVESVGTFPTAATTGLRRPTLLIKDNGDVLLADWSQSQLKRRPATGGWRAVVTLAGNFAAGVMNRRGDIVGLDAGGFGTNSHTVAYDAITANMLPSPGWVLGVPETAGVSWPGVDEYGAMLLAVDGTAFITLTHAYDVLPSASKPAGSGRPLVHNLWGLFLR